MVIFSDEQEELALRCLTEKILDGEDVARQMMSTAKYCSNLGYAVPVVTAAENGKDVGVVYDGYWAVG